MCQLNPFRLVLPIGMKKAEPYLEIVDPSFMDIPVPILPDIRWGNRVSWAKIKDQPAGQNMWLGHPRIIFCYLIMQRRWRGGNSKCEKNVAKDFLKSEMKKLGIFDQRRKKVKQGILSNIWSLMG